MGEVDCLKACAECGRHVRCGEQRCPFCGAALTFFMRAPEYRLKTRLGRGATYALGAALGAAGFVIGCQSSTTSAYGGACTPLSCAPPPNEEDASAGSSGAGGSDQSGGASAVGEGGAAGAAEEPSENDGGPRSP
jgi:hypothetical protein